MNLKQLEAFYEETKDIFDSLRAEQIAAEEAVARDSENARLNFFLFVKNRQANRDCFFAYKLYFIKFYKSKKRNLERFFGYKIEDILSALSLASFFMLFFKSFFRFLQIEFYPVYILFFYSFIFFLFLKFFFINIFYAFLRERIFKPGLSGVFWHLDEMWDYIHPDDFYKIFTPFNNIFRKFFYFFIFLRLLILCEPFLFIILNFIITYFLLFNKFFFISFFWSFFILFSRFTFLITDRTFFYFFKSLQSIDNLTSNFSLFPTYKNVVSVSIWVCRSFQDFKFYTANKRDKMEYLFLEFYQTYFFTRLAYLGILNWDVVFATQDYPKNFFKEKYKKNIIFYYLLFYIISIIIYYYLEISFSFLNYSLFLIKE